ncbi:glycoside hydrolase, partial [Aureobasidium melanogenum]
MVPRKKSSALWLLCVFVLLSVTDAQAQVRRPSCTKTGGLSKIIGYYEGWSSQQPCRQDKLRNIPIGVYTHINLAYATIDPQTFEVLPPTRGDADLYPRVGQSRWDPDLSMFISVGGWTFNELSGPTATTFSDLVASEDNQRAFIKSLISFMSTYGFDGVDLDWSYPGAKNRGGRPEDYENFPRFVGRLKEALRGTTGRQVLSITLPASNRYLQHYDVKTLANDVDYFNVKSFDLHGTWDKGDQWTEARMGAHTNLTEIQDALDHLWRNNVYPYQVVLGLALYGRGFTATSSSCMEPGCPFESGSLYGNCSLEIGVLHNTEIDQLLIAKDIEPKFYEDAAVKVAKCDDQWIAYDDVETLGIKVDLAKGQCLGGVMVSAMTHDDYDGTYSKALDKAVARLPLLDGALTAATAKLPQGAASHEKQMNVSKQQQSLKRTAEEALLTDAEAMSPPPRRNNEWPLAPPT